MDLNSSRFIWYVSQCEKGQDRLCVLDSKQRWMVPLKFHDWAICTKFSVSLLSTPCSLWLFYMGKDDLNDL